MKEIPILMSTPMAYANVAGLKIQTRRMVNRQINIDGITSVGFSVLTPENHIEVRGYDTGGNHGSWFLKLKYGKKGDLLWQRETVKLNYFDDGKPAYKADWNEIAAEYVKEPRWTPGIHMPKEAARVWMLNKGVRIERLNGISEEDCIKEGLRPENGKMWPMFGGLSEGKKYMRNFHWTAKESYRSLFISINKPTLIKSKEGIPLRYDVVCWDDEHAAEIPEVMGRLKLPVNKIINPPVWVIDYDVLSINGKQEAINKIAFG